MERKESPVAKEKKWKVDQEKQAVSSSGVVYGN